MSELHGSTHAFADGMQNLQSFQLAPELSRAYLLHHRLCPTGLASDGALIVAAAPDAHLEAASDDLRLLYRCERIESEPVSENDLTALIERLLASSTHHAATQSQDDAVGIDLLASETAFDTADVRDLALQPPVIRYVNLLIRDAYDSSASDIHLEATRTGLVARYRVDGVLTPAQEPPREMQHAVISRIKLLADLDIAERRRPQDGRIRVRLDARELDLRVATVPTMHGESVALRLLDRGGRPVSLEDLGMDASDLATVQQLCLKPHGMMLVTGPTGSGKTTSLYAMLQSRDSAAEKIITVEDPVEYQLGGVAQVAVQRQAGVTFASALRAILRQDPDVVMIGEMRDAETAEIAVQAAMTGHLVFSTLHTNDAISAVARLVDLGVPEYLITATLEAVIAQRLVRKVCAECRSEYTPASAHVSALSGRPAGRRKLIRGIGCKDCRGTGYKGRVGLFEVLVLTDDLKDAISRREPRAVLRELAVVGGLRSMRAAAWSKVEAGLTTVEEALRVVQS